ncbi:porin [Piscinibacter defluvii]|uniref:porin n=1 Tax=Piscinibacter defluvii TaxID=1796922 RepID=UPI000FDF329A|nr:porin [Piscinibacter defluvii]
MKRILALTALAAASSAAFAQSSVTAYGILDGGVSQVTGLRGGTRTFLVSGIMDGSRLGFRGNEDLGGGYRALFTMEHRMEIDTGGINNRPLSGSQLPDRLTNATLLGLPTFLQPAVDNVAAALGSTIGVNLANNMWDRQVFVGLVTPFGAGLAGRQYTPAYEVSASFDVMGTQSSLAAGQVASFPPSVDIRVSNAVAYRIAQGPFSASLMYGLGEGSTSTGRMIGGMAMYKADAFGAGIGYNTRNNERGDKALSSLVLGGYFAIGPGALYGQYAQVKDDNPAGLSALRASLVSNPQLGPVIGGQVADAFTAALRQDGRLYHGGYKMVTGPHTVYLAATSYDDKRPNNADTMSYGVAYTYSFSKRTDVNAVLTHFNNKNLGQAAPGQAGFIGGVTDRAGTDSNSVALGLRHRF